MSQFDETTNRISAEKADDGQSFNDRLCWRSGRNSTKEGLEIAARALKFYAEEREGEHPINGLTARKAIAKMKAIGDWPLEET